MALRKGSGLAILWAEVPEATRADLAARLGGEPPVPDPGAGVLSVGRYVAVVGGPALVEVYELVEARAAGAAACARLQETTRQAVRKAGGDVLVAAYRQVFPPAVDERNALHGPPPALQMGRISIPPEHEDEFNEWYNTEYLVGYQKVPGVYSARRYVNTGAGTRYLTVYELAHEEVSRQPEWDRARMQSVWRRRIERLWRHDVGSPGIYRRIAGA